MGDGVTIVNITANVKTEEGNSKFVICDLKSGFIDPDILISLGLLKKRWGLAAFLPIFPHIFNFQSSDDLSWNPNKSWVIYLIKHDFWSSANAKFFAIGLLVFVKYELLNQEIIKYEPFEAGEQTWVTLIKKGRISQFLWQEFWDSGRSLKHFAKNNLDFCCEQKRNESWHYL